MPPIVFLPGAGGRASFWAPVAERLADLGPSYLLDWPGFGGAPPDPGIHSTSDLFDWMLPRLPPGPAHVVAQSMGGVLAVRLAIEFPERVDRLVLVATSGGVDLRSTGAADWRPEYLASLPDVPRWFVEDRTDLTARLCEIRAPTLLLWSDSDPVSPPAVAHLLEERIPNVRRVVIPGGTHAFACERPEEVAAAIRAHITASAAATVRVVPWSSLPDLAPIAALLRRSPEDLRVAMAGMPAGVEGLAILEEERPSAVGLFVQSNLTTTGRCSLSWLSTDPGASPSAALRLVVVAEERARRAGAHALEIVEKDAPGVAFFLEERGYRNLDAVIRMRRGAARAGLPLLEGVAEVPLEVGGLEAWAELSNAAFEGVAFNASLSRSDLERLSADPGFDASLVRLLRDDAGPVGFLHGAIGRGGVGEVESIGLVPRARGRGLGRWLLRRCEQLLAERGARDIELRVAQSNGAAVSLYLQEGYIEVSRSSAWERAL